MAGLRSLGAPPASSCSPEGQHHAQNSEGASPPRRDHSGSHRALTFGGLVGIAAPAQAAPARSSISITSLKSSSGDQIVKGGKLTIGGKTSTNLRKRTLSVYLTRGRSTSNLNITTRVSAASRFSVTIPVNTGAGTAKYSLRFSGTKTVAKASSTKSVKVAEWFPLTDQEVVNSGEQWGWSHPMSRDNVRVGGKTYTRAIATTWLGGNRSSWSEWNLGYHCFTFSSLVGLADDSSTGGVIRTAISADGTRRYSRDVGLGAPTSVSFGLSGAFRLRIDAQSVADPDANVAFPSAKVLCTANPNPAS